MDSLKNILDAYEILKNKFSKENIHFISYLRDIIEVYLEFNEIE